MADEEDSGGDAEANDDEGSPCGPSQGDGEIWYLNTDLDVHADSDADLGLLVDALESRGLYALTPTEHRQNENGWAVVFGTDDTFREPDPNIAKMLDAIESLDPASRDLWRACTLREFNIGYHCGDRPWAYNQAVSSTVIGRAAAAGVSLRITLYPPERPSGS